ncbi:ornithine carbamoyltransferase [Candidatus Micrarchaeota archaeon CG08_land_8_20_14_0_20_49_17]|nr:MAG: ornithine carbamoyltransferase [Candidatus Micrarchaeota archaeon CG1_02_49_24]PIU09442.1 MAG: ornithine carbamoyltransferase [Candidatus Micrarchaeota archaeon CG08_land_8_20_14_0_20_49_17]PIZ92883.1 MAG: ornithine carbamoyltransferase [Candidatus Micrarchaeota archaeon CG_4_10_14_0_2_um_filter_49_7]HII53892.1 ornithine carbamoyltransferase [Candidatus Micrarchaeota archaeon]
MKHLLKISDLKKAELEKLLTLAESVKKNPVRYAGKLDGLALALLFEKASTRTRVSFEVAAQQLGASSLYLDYVTMQLSRGESWEDTARVMSRYVGAMVARLYKHSDIEQLARYSSIPIINGLTDLEHPCQALSDIFTIRENGLLKKGKKFVYIGDGAFNMANSLLAAVSQTGMSITMVCPAKYAPAREYLQFAKRHTDVEVVSDVRAAVKGADIIYTDVWVSMGQENEKAERIKNLIGYQVNEELVKAANPGVKVMHCLPAYRGYEITGEVISGRHSVIYDQAENRLHLQKALLLTLLGKA